MKIGCISDLHGNLPSLPEDLDLLLIAGDICWHENINKEEKFLTEIFLDWLNHYKFPKIGIAGNHDFYLEKNKTINGIEILENSHTKVTCGTYNPIRIFGTPLSLEVGEWAYQASEEDIFRATANVDCNIMISHGPAYGLLDKVLPRGWDRTENVGSTCLRNYLEINKPKLLVHGHIHESRGVVRFGNTVIINASIVDGQYRQQNKLYVVDWSSNPMGHKVNYITEWDCLTKTYSKVNY